MNGIYFSSLVSYRKACKYPPGMKQHFPLNPIRLFRSYPLIAIYIHLLSYYPHPDRSPDGGLVGHVSFQVHLYYAGKEYLLK